MTNGSNSWNVSYSRITFIERKLRMNRNVIIKLRRNDLVFEIERRKQKDNLNVLCLDEYTMSLTSVERALDEFGGVNIICLAGEWNGYTKEAKDYCLDNKIGLYVPSEMYEGLLADEFWGYAEVDEKGNPRYRYKVA